MSREKVRYIKYAAVIVAAVIVGIFLGRFFTRYDTRYLLSRRYCGSYRGIDVYECGEINEENFIGHAYMLESAPDILTDCCTAMYFTGGSLSIPIIGHGDALGLTQDSIIYISTDTFNVDVIYHELFHAYDNVNGNLSRSDEFMSIYYEEKDSVFVEVLDEAARPAEFFAASGALYLLEPETLKSAAPQVYGYIDRRIDFYE